MKTGLFLKELVLAVLHPQLRHAGAQGDKELGQHGVVRILDNSCCLGHEGCELCRVVLLARTPHVCLGGANVTPAEIALQATGEWANPLHGGVRW